MPIDLGPSPTPPDAAPTAAEQYNMRKALGVEGIPYNAGGSLTGSVTLSHANGSLQKGTLTGSITLNAFTGGAEGKRLELWLTPSGADRDLDLHADIKRPSDSSITFPKTLTQNKLYVVAFRHNGTNWMLISVVGGF